jgi:hypothetical protein
VTFTVTPHHPQRDRVNALLARVRREVEALWQEVASYNGEHPPNEDQATRITFYCGQFACQPESVSSE